MTTDFSHLDAILARMSREEQRLAQATTDRERAFRAQQVAAAAKELAAEYKFLGITPASLDDVLSDDELLAELKGA